jgi:hypothetical protein
MNSLQERKRRNNFKREKNLSEKKISISHSKIAATTNNTQKKNNFHFLYLLFVSVFLDSFVRSKREK